MKTTVDISDGLFRDAKRYAHAHDSIVYEGRGE
jgi:hypothetical protein